MSEWREARLGEVCSRLRSGTNITAKDIHEVGEVPVFGGNGIRGYASEPNFSGECAIIGRQGAYCGNVRYFNGAARMSEHAVVAVADAGNNTRFLAYLLSTMNLGRLSGQAAQPGLSVKILAQEPVLMPPLDLQARVASFVGSIDDLIENNRRRIEVLEEALQAIYREWFVKFRFPGHEHAPMVDSALGPIPEGWRAATIGDALELKYGKALKASARRGGGVAVVSSAGVVGWHDESFVDGPAIVVGRKGNVGSVHWVDGPCWPIDTAYFVQTDLPLSFVSEQLRRTAFTNSHAAVPGLSREAAYAQPFLLPDVQVLDSFQALVDPLGSHATGLMSQNEKLAEVRDLLLPKLVTGQIDVSSLDLDAVISTGSTEESAVAQ